MEDKDLELFGLGVLGHIFGLFDKGKENEKSVKKGRERRLLFS